MIKNIIKQIYRATLKPIIISITGRKINSSIDDLLQYKNKHLSERCFIIGNGPSLTAVDLDKLKNEICFGSHCVYEIFDKTDWRPTYYCAQDLKLIKQIKDDISEKIKNTKFIGTVKSHIYPDIKEANYINLVCEEFYPELPNFSEDISKGVYEGFTVTYMAIQIAVYMGFKEIVLLGVDHNYSMTMMPDGTVAKQQDIDDYFSKNDRNLNIPQLYKTTLAYQVAKKYADEHGIKIYNATRGGKLEVFERVDFDTIV